MEFKNTLVVPQVKAQLADFKGHSNPCSRTKHLAPPAPRFPFAAAPGNPATCWGRGTGRCSRGHRPGGTSSSCLSCCAMFPLVAWMRHLFLLREWVLGRWRLRRARGGCGSRGGVRLWSRVTAAARSAGGKSRAEFKVAGAVQSASIKKKTQPCVSNAVKLCVECFLISSHLSPGKGKLLSLATVWAEIRL